MHQGSRVVQSPNLGERGREGGRRQM